jgi:outer membrane protein OmpA-like peptidoglycan-associated protein
VKLLIDDPTTHAPDGYAIDFVRILVNPHSYRYTVELAGFVLDAENRSPIVGATVTAALSNTTTDAKAQFTLKNLPAGMVTASAIAPGYDEAVVAVDIEAGNIGHTRFDLHRHKESTTELERAIGESGSAVVYGIHFDVNSATLRPDSTPALENVLALITKKPDTRWIISGHTDNQGAAELNARLSQARAAAVIAWMGSHGVAAGRLKAEGFASGSRQRHGSGASVESARGDHGGEVG